MRRQRVGQGLCSTGLFILLVLRSLTPGAFAQEPPQDESAGFEIRAFVVEGNTLFTDAALRGPLKPFIGSAKTAGDVEKARAALEKAYHDAGYVSVMVNIPVPQTVEHGRVRLEVIESTIGNVRVTGNRTFTRANVLQALPALAPGRILYLPDVQRELDLLNRNPDLKVAPVLMPGSAPGTVDVELKVKDRLPLHGNLDVNNRSTHDTTELRLNGLLRYDNLWQLEHTLSAQFQLSPQDPAEVQVAAGSYTLPTPWSPSQMLALYGIWSNSDTAFGEGFQVLGKGYIVGAQYAFSLPPFPVSERWSWFPLKTGDYAHNLAFAVEFKDLEENVGAGPGAAGFRLPVRYLPFSLAYGASLPDSWGLSMLELSLHVSIRGVVSDTEEFDQKRYNASPNYVYGRLLAARTQRLPAGMELFVELEGQIADGPLISNEQYIAGGMKNVRGYQESEETSDDALFGTVELRAPELAALAGLPDWFQFVPFAFYDRAHLWLNDPLPGQCGSGTLSGTGLGFRGMITSHVAYELDWGVALSDSSRTPAGVNRVYFSVTGQF